MRRALKKLVFVEPKSTHLHIYSRVCIPRIGSVLLATIMRREWEYLAIAPDDLDRRLDEPVIVVGDGADSIRSPLAHRIVPPRRGPAPAVVGALGHARLAIGEAVAAAELVPIYLRPSEAELKRRGAAVS